MTIAAAKALVRSLWPEWRERVFGGLRSSVFAADVAFHGPAPIGTVHGRETLLNRIYAPLDRTFPGANRQPYLFLGGEFDGAMWVATTGDVVGDMAEPWLGIPPAPAPVRLRFGEFYRVVDGQIAEIRCLFDILGLAAQAGHALLPPFEGRAEVPPGPTAANGLCFGAQNPNATAKTLDLVESMIGGCNRLDARGLASMGMAAFWHPDMVWHGPWGIGSCFGFREFQDYAQGPSVASFPDRRGGHHRARIADGVTAAFTGWPSLRGTFSGAPFHGLAPTGRPIGMNLMDFYVRRGDKLLENWVLIDLIDFWKQCGIDLLEPLRQPAGA